MQIYYILLSLMTFVLWGVDKFRAREGQWRISERQLFTMVLLGGAFGALPGMLLFRHKTRKPLFWAAVILGCVVHVGIYFYLA